MMSRQVKFYGLLYVSLRANDGAYLQRLNPEKRIEFYLRMALRLAKGIHARFGLPLELVTNNEPYLAKLLDRITNGQACQFMNLVQVDFSAVNIPESARYFSATHKVSLFDYFSRQSDFSVLLDIDVICLDGKEQPIAGFIRDDAAMVYDISDQVFPAHGYGRILADMAKFGPIDSRFRWFGGEFIAGGPDFFKELSALANEALPRYGEIFQTLHHQGDEMITSYCLNRMRMTSSPNLPLDAGGPDMVRRHHGKATLHDERRLRQIDNIRFLHLPTVKSLLASNLSDRSIVRILRGAELLPRRLAGPFLAVSGALASLIS